MSLYHIFFKKSIFNPLLTTYVLDECFMQNVVIYARYSSDKQRDASIEGQIQECTEYAQANSLTVIKTYADRALSGTTDERA